MCVMLQSSKIMRACLAWMSYISASSAKTEFVIRIGQFRLGEGHWATETTLHQASTAAIRLMLLKAFSKVT